MAENIIRQVWSVSWQAAVLCVMVLIIERIIKHPSPQFRYLLWWSVPLRLCFPPVIPLPAVVQHYTRSAFETVAAITSNMPAYPMISVLSPHITAPGESSVHGITPAVSPYLYLAVVWIGTVTVLGIKHLLAVAWMKHRIGRFEPVTDMKVLGMLERLKSELGIAAPVSIRVCGDADACSPMVTGLLRPTIVLPSYLLSEIGATGLEPILIHELVHIKQGDLWKNRLLAIVHIVYFFHPAVWFAQTRLRALSEDICDDLSIVYLTGSRKEYFKSILTVLEKLKEHRTPVFAEAYSVERKSSLSKRIIRLTRPDYTYFRPMSVLSQAGILLIVVCSILVAHESTAMFASAPGADQRMPMIPVAYGSERIQLTVHDDDVFEIDGAMTNAARLDNVLVEQMRARNTNRLVVIIAAHTRMDTIILINTIAFRNGCREIAVRWMPFRSS